MKIRRMSLPGLARRGAVVAAGMGLVLTAQLAGPTSASAASPLFPDTARSTLMPTPLVGSDGQFIPGTTTGVTANMSFTDNSLLLSTSGTAQGLSPNFQYVSLIYGLRSNADVAGNTAPGPCVDDGTLGAVISQSPGNVLFSPVATTRMLQGLWFPPDPVTGTARFSSTKPTVTPLGITIREGKTVSIRQATNYLDALNLFSDLRPQVFVIQACGLIIPNNYPAAYPIP